MPACVCVCVSAPEAKSNSSLSLSLTFQSLYMALAIDITDGRCLSNEARRELLLKKSKVML